MKSIELLAPAGSMESAIAAVRSGANAIYMGFGNFNARRNAKNFSKEEMAEICDYCRARGVKTNITVNTLLNDREFASLESTVEDLCQIAPDALIVADPGVAKAIHQMAPHLCLHASTQLTVHNVEGAKAAKSLGFSRVVLSRELDENAIREIIENVDIETEVFVHGALCMCYSGQCYMSGFIGRRSGNRGLCAQPCRLPYKVNGAKNETYPLSLKDLCLAHDLKSLRNMGVSSLKIEGRMKRPEYVATVCSIYSRLLREDRTPTKEEMDTLRNIFSRDGFTDGYFKNKRGAKMFGTRKDELPADDALYKEAQKIYSGETPLIPVDFEFTAKLNSPSSLTVRDNLGNLETVCGASAVEAINRPLTAEVIVEKLSKTGGTPFFPNNITCNIEENLSLPLSAINALRRDALDALLSTRAKAERIPAEKLAPIPQAKGSGSAPAVTVSLSSAAQLSPELLSLPISRIYIPVTQLKPDKLPENIGISMPQIIWDKEWAGINEKLRLAKEMGINHVLVSNIGQISPLVAEDFTVEGDICLNIFNSRTLSCYKDMGLKRATLSPELMLSQIRDIKKTLPCSIVAYGHLPLMITENCAISSTCKCPGEGPHTLVDRRGAVFPVACLPGHRNMIYNPDVLYLADKLHDLDSIGIEEIRLLFTVETKDQVAKITEEYITHRGTPPRNFTRGLYYRGVE